MTRRDLQGYIAWSALPGIGSRTLLALQDHAREGRGSLADLWEGPLADLHALVPLPPRARTELDRHAGERWEAAEAEATEVETWGVDLLAAGEPDAPAALRRYRREWPFLFAYGALELLDEPRVALVNSRDVSNHGLIITDALADALARRDVTLVTSINRDSYKAAATAAKRHAGPAILALDRGIATVFPDGIAREPVAPARVWDESFDPDLQLLLSPFGWREPWHPRAGPRRDALIVDLADVVVSVDVRPGGGMFKHCIRAAGAGKQVLAIDRAEAEGPRLWEQEPGISRIPWKGAEEVVARVLEALPGERPQVRERRHEEARAREIAGFLARACRRLSDARSPAVAAHPAAGALGEAARAWSRGECPECNWLLVDLAAEAPERVSLLLDRIAKDGLCAAIVPAAWLDGDAHAAHREAWLRRASLQAVVRLPRAEQEPPIAAILLRKGDSGPQPAPAFVPEREPMTRFQLRRYLQEVLRSLA